jgi:hypothetical protein
MHRALTFALLAVAGASPAVAQQASTAATPPVAPAARRTLTAIRVAAEVTIDGRLDDPSWADADVATGFVQYQPDPGAPPSQRTVVRVLYDDDAIYVGARLYDSAPDSIVARLARRDEGGFSDWFYVAIDSYFDRRTAFSFGVNPRAVKIDRQYSDDAVEDVGWDAVWDAATAIDAEGWVAELRIPLSQLRFSAGGDGEQVWGVNFRRYLARADETSDWSPVPRGGGAFVSRAGDLQGLTDLAPRRRLEIQPYVLAGVRRAPGDDTSPFFEPTALTSTAGADVRYGVTSDLTLSATLNPDFGQVEADPSVLNLSGFETFFPERRPFFLEGAEIFRPVFPALPTIFHSRRIGRAPQGSPPDQAVHASAPEATTILGAAKLTGKTADGWSVGLFDAVTTRERARFVDPTGTHGARPVEPLTNYGALRLARDFDRGQGALGLLATSTNRALPATDELDFLPASAYVAGLDGHRRFGGGRYQVAASLFGSRVAGSAAAIDDIQRSPVHRANRPDARHAGYDPSRTELLGYSANVRAEKRDGHWRFVVEGRTRSPGFEVNDLGFLGRADQASTFGHGWFDQFRPGRVFRRWRVDVASWANVTFGGERLWTGAEAWGEAQFHNRWTVAGGAGYDLPRLDVDALRGGPAIHAESRWWRWLRFSTDPTKSVNVEGGGAFDRERTTGGWIGGVNATINLRPSDRLGLALGPALERNVNPWQFVANRDAGDGRHYVRGHLEQTTAWLTLRAAYTFTPDLSLQVYAQPFVSAGSYGDFRRVASPRDDAFETRFTRYEASAVMRDPVAGGYAVDADGNGSADFTFDDPDFTFRELRSNVVLRWEYRPGSALFLVWSQGRAHADGGGRFRLGRDLADLLSAPGTNTVMVKLSYWLGN